MALWQIIILAMLSSVGQAWAQAPKAPEISGEPIILEGDTLAVKRKLIFLHGIDAMDKEQSCGAKGQEYPCGEQAANALRSFVGGKKIRCVEIKVDKYGRTLSECFKGKINLNAWMVENGWALAYRRYTLAYAPQEDLAKKNKAGIWKGEFEKPWIYRYNEMKKEKK